MDLYIERIVHDQEQNETNTGVELPEQEREKVKLWYDKIKPMVNHDDTSEIRSQCHT